MAFGNYSVLAALLRFDTSSLPDGATITAATLKLHVTAKTDADNRSLVGEWYPSSNWPIDAADYTLNSSANALTGADITQISTGAVSEEWAATQRLPCGTTWQCTPSFFRQNPSACRQNQV